MPVLKLTEDTFDAEVLKSDLPVLVDFWADWCGPCRQIAPVVEALAEKFDGQIKVGKLDVDAAQKIPVRYGVRAIPTLLLFQKGEITAQVVGAAPRTQIEKAIKDALKQAGADA